MTMWVVRAGRDGAREQFALENGFVVVGWDEVPDLSLVQSRQALAADLQSIYRDRQTSTLRVWAGELFNFARSMSVGDLVALPLITTRTIAFGQITGGYEFRPEHPPAARHCRRVRWIRTDVARTEIDQDILNSLGATLAVFSVKRNDAERRLRQQFLGEAVNTKVAPAESPSQDDDVTVDPVESQTINVDDIATNQIVEFIGRRFHGHEMAVLVEAVLQAQGYRTHRSPPGPDGGVDIVAGLGALGFDAPRLCVQVKSGVTPQDITVVRELRGVMNDVGAEHGLLVAWGGFRTSVHRETARRFFEIRLWDSTELVAQISSNYEKLPAEVQAELPLKRVWALVQDQL